MKFDKFMSYYKRKNFIIKCYKNFGLKTSPRSFVFAKFYAQPLLENGIFEASYLYYIIAKLPKFVQISLHTTSDSFIQSTLKIKKDLKLVPRPHFSYNFTRMCLLLKLFSKMGFVFHAWAFDDVITFEYLKS